LTFERHRKLADAARALNAKHRDKVGTGMALPALFFFTDGVRTPNPLAAIEKLPEGCGVVFRHYDVSKRAALATAVATACAAQDRLCLVAGDTDLATNVGAGGVHLPEHMLRKLTIRPKMPIVTTAAHSVDVLLRAQDLGLDAVFLSPVFATPSHPDAVALGVDNFTQLVRETTLPVYGLGGITEENAGLLAGSGGVGLAAIGGLL